MDYCIGDVRFENLEAALEHIVKTGEEGSSQEIFFRGTLFCTATPGVAVDGRVGVPFVVIDELVFETTEGFQNHYRLGSITVTVMVTQVKGGGGFGTTFF